MPRSTLPRVPKNLFPGVVEALKLRMKQVDMTQRKISKRTGINIYTLGDIFTQKTPPRLDTLDTIMECLGREDETENPFPTYGVIELLEWAERHKDELENGKQRRKDAEHTRSMTIGAILKARSTSIGVSQHDLANHITATTGRKISFQRVQQIEAGKFAADNATAEAMATALGYSGIDKVLEESKREIVAAPAWVDALHKSHETRQEKTREHKRRIGSAIQLLCTQKNWSRAQTDGHAGYNGLTEAVITGGSYTPERLAKLIRALGIGSGSEEDLLAYYEQQRYRDGGAHLASRRQMLQMLAPSMQILRGALHINATQLSEAMPEKFRLKKGALHNREKMGYTIDDGLVGSLAGIYNAGRNSDQPDIFRDCENLHKVSVMAERPDADIVYTREFITLLEGAMMEIIDSAKAVGAGTSWNMRMAQSTLAALDNDRSIASREEPSPRLR